MEPEVNGMETEVRVADTRGDGETAKVEDRPQLAVRARSAQELMLKGAKPTEREQRLLPKKRELKAVTWRESRH